MRPSHWPVTLRPRPLIGQCHLITRLYLSSLLSSLPLLRYSDLSRRLIFEKTVIICKSSPIRSIGQNSFFILWRCVRLVRWRINLVYTSISKCSDQLYIDTNFRTISLVAYKPGSKATPHSRADHWTDKSRKLRESFNKNLDDILPVD